MKQESNKSAKKPRAAKTKHEIERKWLEKFATKEEFNELKREMRQSSEMMFKHFTMFEKNLSTIISGEVKHMSLKLLTWMMPFMLTALASLCSITYHIFYK